MHNIKRYGKKKLQTKLQLQWGMQKWKLDDLALPIFRQLNYPGWFCADEPYRAYLFHSERRSVNAQTLVTLDFFQLFTYHRFSSCVFPDSLLPMRQTVLTFLLWRLWDTLGYWFLWGFYHVFGMAFSPTDSEWCWLSWISDRIFTLVLNAPDWGLLYMFWYNQCK